MRFRKIALENHPIFTNLNLDFTDEENKSVETLILAGENGAGKTSVLDLLYEFSMINLSNKKRDERRSFEIELTPKELEILSNNENYKHFFNNGFANGIFTVEFDFNIMHNWNQIKVSFHDSDNNEKTVTGDFFQQPEIKQIIRVVYSDVEINYTSKQLKSVTAKDLDENIPGSYKSDGNLATDITQLLIDVQSLDSQEFAQWAKQNIGNAVDETKIDTRIKRFTTAFDSIFPSKKFLGIENRNNAKEVLFQEDGKTMSINQLSSGEKQIVFRGGFLLKDKGVSKGATFLIDEPEISLHPKWQIEILDFYKRVINESSSEESSQMIFSTHSPFIIHNPNRRNDKVVILSKDETGQITALETPEFYSWTNNKVVKEAFQVDFNLQESPNKIYLEGETDEKYFKKTIEVFDLNTLQFEISWIGRINENGNTEFTGDTALNHAKSFFVANSDILKSKVVLFYDSDTKKPEETLGNLLIRKMPLNTDNELYKIGIENLLVLPETFDKDQFYTERWKEDDYGAQSVIRTLDKTKLCAWVCEECTTEQQKEILINLVPLLTTLNNEM
ncbi:AAA family ATPase [Gaetbulibacter sp. M235]|uniref:AAA family ATPase n=1 Tax=Gaetbulibacter sp. M235 TaxID=3126510 RepID=UPI00374F597F